jgi:hypothetical protein
MGTASLRGGNADKTRFFYWIASLRVAMTNTAKVSQLHNLHPTISMLV